jgi:hypothetical protein
MTLRFVRFVTVIGDTPGRIQVFNMFDKSQAPADRGEHLRRYSWGGANDNKNPIRRQVSG